MLELRCFARKDGNAYVAVCIDLCLAAQGETMQGAVEKLDSMIHFYVADVLENEREFAHQLLNRKAPLSQRFTWHVIDLINRIRFAKHYCLGYIKRFVDYIPEVHHA